MHVTIKWKVDILLTLKGILAELIKLHAFTRRMEAIKLCVNTEIAAVFFLLFRCYTQ